MDYIPINSVKDLDIRKISIRDINKRYIDREGNRFATRYNMQKRRIEIVRLARNRTEAQRLRGEILRGKREAYLGKKPDFGDQSVDEAEGMSEDKQNEAVSSPADTSQDSSSNTTANASPGFEEGLEDGLDLEEDFSAAPDIVQPASQASPEPALDPETMLEQQFLEDATINLGRMKDRQISILNALKNLQGTITDTQEVSELHREIDMNCWQKSDESINYYKELYGYPRSISHYLIRLHPDLKERLRTLPGDEERMHLIRTNESARVMEEAFYNFYNMTDRLSKVFQKVTPEVLKQLPITLSRQVEDAITSCSTLLKDIRTKQTEFKVWRKKYC